MIPYGVHTISGGFVPEEKIESFAALEKKLSSTLFETYQSRGGQQGVLVLDEDAGGKGKYHNAISLALSAATGVVGPFWGDIAFLSPGKAKELGVSE